jgi:hypothetical protein
MLTPETLRKVRRDMTREMLVPYPVGMECLDRHVNELDAHAHAWSHDRQRIEELERLLRGWLDANAIQNPDDAFEGVPGSLYAETVAALAGKQSDAPVRVE